MKCKVFKLHIENNSDESILNKFLEGVEAKQIFAQVIGEGGHFWSVLVFYENESALKNEKINTATVPAENVSFIDDTKNAEKSASESLVLTPEQESVFNALKKWRNEKAARDGIPPYMIAHNFSLLQIAASPIASKEDLIGIKGFGEKRAEKYGEEILEILSASPVE